MDTKPLASKHVMIAAGEASGDLHGAGLVRSMLETDPSLKFFGMGGEELAGEGVEIVIDLSTLSVMGFTEVFASIREIHTSLKQLKRVLKKKKPALLVLIDFADFNLRLAKEAKKLGIPVFYYITPKVWVWRKRRVKKLRKYVDSAGVILPFEEEYLKERGVNARYVGNPTLESVSVKFTRSQFCQKYNIDEKKALVGIIPGSRKKEVSFLLPVFLESAKRMQQKYSRELAFLIPLASTLSLEDIDRAGLASYKQDLEIHILPEDRYELMAACDAVVAASGTVTLELTLLDIPMVVAYKFTPTSYMIGKALINIPYFSLVNILSGKGVVTELLQDQVEPATVEIELARILFDEDVRNYMKKEFSEVRAQLGGAKASQRAAQLAFETMGMGG